MFDLVLIADAGGTKTNATAVAVKGARVASLSAVGCVPCVDFDGALSIIDSLLEKALGEFCMFRSQTHVALSLACAGLDSTKIEQQFKRQLLLRFDTVELQSDGDAALAACRGGGPGAVVAIGTGVVATARLSDGSRMTIDGWGWPSGDRGGGAWIGRTAVELFLRAYDFERFDADPLFMSFRNVIGQNRDEIINWLTRATRANYAALCPYIAEAAKLNSEVARNVFTAAGAQLNETIDFLAQHGIRGTCITGGLAPTLFPYLNGAELQLFEDAPFVGARLKATKWLVESPESSRVFPNG